MNFTPAVISSMWWEVRAIEMFVRSPDSGHHVASDTLRFEFRKRVLQRFPQKGNYSSSLRFTIDMKVKDLQTGRENTKYFITRLDWPWGNLVKMFCVTPKQRCILTCCGVSSSVWFLSGLPAVLSMPWLVSPGLKCLPMPLFSLELPTMLRVPFLPRSLARFHVTHATRCHGTFCPSTRQRTLVLLTLMITGPPKSGRDSPQ